MRSVIPMAPYQNSSASGSGAPRAGEVAPALSWPRLATPSLLAVVLLLVEYWIFKNQFDTTALADSPRWWAAPVRWLRFNTSWGLCVIGAGLLIGGSRIVAAWKAIDREVSRPRPVWRALGGHLVWLVAFFLLTPRLLEPGEGSGLLEELLPLPWLVSGAVAASLLGSLVAPPRFLLSIALRLRWVLLGSVALGSAVFGVWTFLAEVWPFWEPMARGTMLLAYRLLGLVFAECTYDPATLTLGTEEFRVWINQYCSGYEGVSLFLVFFCLFLALYRHRLRFPQALLLLPLGALFAWTLNAVRVAALIVFGTLVSPETAMKGFHVYAGWPLLCGVALGCVALGTRVRFFSGATVCRRGGVNPTAIYLGPLLVLTATTLVVGAFSAAPEALYPVRWIPVLLVLWIHRREHAHLRPAWSWTTVALGVVAFAAWATLLLWFPVGTAENPGSSGFVEFGPPSGAWALLWWPARIVGTCLLTPIVEELAFRGFLLRRLISADFESVRPGALSWPALLASSLAFGLLHEDWRAGTAAGIVYALAYCRRGRLFDAVLAHAVTNVVMVCVTFATGNERLWG